MSMLAYRLRTLMGCAAVAVAMFASCAVNAGVFDTASANLNFSTHFPDAVVAAVGDNYAGVRADAFISDLSKALKAPETPEGKVRKIKTPAVATENMMTVYAVVPPQKLSDASDQNDAYGRITVCVQNEGKAKGAWEISQKTGLLTPINIVGPGVTRDLPDGKFWPACGDTLTAASAALAKQYAQLQETNKVAPPAAPKAPQH